MSHCLLHHPSVTALMNFSGVYLSVPFVLFLLSGLDTPIPAPPAGSAVANPRSVSGGVVPSWDISTTFGAAGVLHAGTECGLDVVRDAAPAGFGLGDSSQQCTICSLEHIPLRIRHPTHCF